MSKINIEFTLFSAFYSPLILTMAGGFLKQEGLNYEWRVAPPGVSAVEAIKSGSAQVIQSALVQGFNALRQGVQPPEVHFAQVNEMEGFFITGRDARKDFDWLELEGAEVVMFKAGQPNAMFRYACHKAGIDYDRIIPITPGGAADIDAAFRSGQGQFVQQQGPYPQKLEHDGIGHIVAACGPLIGPCACSSLAASRAWLQTDEAKAFTRAYAQARQFLASETAAEISGLLKPFFPDTNTSSLQQCIDHYQKLGCWTPHVEITQAAYAATLDVFEYVNHIDTRYDYDLVCCAPPT